MRVPVLRKTSSGRPGLTSAVEQLITDITKIGTTCPSLIGRVEVVSAPESETRHPVRPQTQPVLLCLVVQASGEVVMARGPVTIVVTSLVEDVSGVEPVATSGRT